MKEKITIQMLSSICGKGLIAGVLFMWGIHYLFPSDKLTILNIVYAIIGLVIGIVVGIYSVRKIEKFKKEKIKIQMLWTAFGLGSAIGILVVAGVHFVSPLDEPDFSYAILMLAGAILVIGYNIYKITKLGKESLKEVPKINFNKQSK